jgi:hypothetical protein
LRSGMGGAGSLSGQPNSWSRLQEAS